LAERYDKSAWQITHTRASKADVAIAGFSEPRIYVASPPADEFSGLIEAAIPTVEQKYILFVGTLEPRKNVELLFEAWAQTPVDDAILVVVGRRGWGAPVNHSESIIEVGAVSDAELLWLYRHAAALVSPSHYEGFGLPIVEALGQGTAVIATDIPASREVAGEAASYFHPEDVAGLSSLMVDALTMHGDRLNVKWEPSGGHSKYSSKAFGDELASAYRAICGAAGL
jgi:glycosyltransferase involved in cell wall biosynthesis